MLQAVAARALMNKKKRKNSYDINKNEIQLRRLKTPAITNFPRPGLAVLAVNAFIWQERGPRVLSRFWEATGHRVLDHHVTGRSHSMCLT
jgi:hypothetical protein